ncbi:DUF4199 domain-containing protein [Flavobacterium sp.]|uniref:DUF4199 domain-containing protein n=1 Tax=Flavobacterium sp. TaxID=239 RepID=UPI0025E5BF21|nr:DUF4199 domain-containing protein [Flavobacterium sp.]
MEKTTSPSKSAIQYGVLFGLIMVVEFVISYILNIDPTTNKGFGITLNLINFLVLPITLILLGCNHYKNKINSGFISFGEAIKIGVVICVIGALIYGIFTAIFNVIFPEFTEEILRKTRDVMVQQNPEMPEEQIEMALSWTKKFMSPAIAVPFTVVMYTFIGLIYSLIIGAIVKKERP